MPRPLSEGRPPWREAERAVYLARAASGLCVRGCEAPAAVTRLGRPGVLCAVCRDRENHRKQQRRAGVPASPRPPRAERKPQDRTGRRRGPRKDAGHGRRTQRRARRRLLALRGAALAQRGAVVVVAAWPTREAL